MGSPSRVRLPACTRSGMLNAGLPLTAAVPRGLLTRFPILPAGPSAGGGPGHPWALCPPHCNGLERACQSIWGRDAGKSSKSAVWDVFKGGGERQVAVFRPPRSFEITKRSSAHRERRGYERAHPIFRRAEMSGHLPGGAAAQRRAGGCEHGLLRPPLLVSLHVPGRGGPLGGAPVFYDQREPAAGRAGGGGAGGLLPEKAAQTPGAAGGLECDLPLDQRLAVPHGHGAPGAAPEGI